jgi:hypothetical protein
MRKQLIEVETLQEAQEIATWAAEIIQVEGGFLAFESMTDYEIWINQK